MSIEKDNNKLIVYCVHCLKKNISKYIRCSVFSNVLISTSKRKAQNFYIFCIFRMQRNNSRFSQHFLKMRTIIMAQGLT